MGGLLYHLGRIIVYEWVRIYCIHKYVLILTGTAKNIFKNIWKELRYLDKAAQAKDREKLDEFVVPHDVGKIRKKIESGFDGLSADEYKKLDNLVFSICI